MKKLEIDLNMEKIPETIEYIRAALIKRRVAKKEITRTLLTAEDVLARMMATAPEGTQVWVSVGGLFGNVEIRLSALGEPFDSSNIEENLLLGSGVDDAEANDVIRRMINKLYADKIRIVNEHGYNRAIIRAKTSQFQSLILTLLALVGGVAVGLLMHNYLPDGVSKGFSKNLFTPVYTMFMNALKMIVAPLVFCSVASSIADFGDLKALGKIAGKIVVFYLFTSMIAICVGFGAYQIFPIGDPSLAGAVTNAAASTIAKGANTSISIKDTIVGIIPNNIITPFQKSDMLQIIFMAVVLGLAAAALAKKAPQIKNTLVLMNNICSKITTVLVGFIPLVVFCSMAKMMIALDLGHLLHVITWVPVIYFGDVLMICVYIVLLMLFAGLNPFKFLGKYYPAMISAYTFASSNAALPSSIKQAEELGISKRIYSFSLPLGATINMDGSCITLMISALFMCKIFAIPVTGSVLLSLFISIMVLSVGAPGVPGGALVCISLLVPQIGVPAESISLIMGLYPLVGMMQTCANVTGDAVATAVVAKHEKLLDIEKYNS